MKRQLFLMIVSLVLLLPVTGKAGGAYTPRRGSEIRKAILDGLRIEVKKMSGMDAIFVIDHLKTHNGWAWVEAQPRSKDGKSGLENISALLHRSADGRWCTVLIPSYECVNADDPDKACQKEDRMIFHNLTSFPLNVPADIFPTSFTKQEKR